MTEVKQLKVPAEWAEKLENIARAEDPLRSWSEKAREVLKKYLDKQEVPA